MRTDRSPRVWRFRHWTLERVAWGWMLSNPYKGHAVHDKTPWKAWKRWRRRNAR